MEQEDAKRQSEEYKYNLNEFKLNFNETWARRPRIKSQKQIFFDTETFL